MRHLAVLPVAAAIAVLGLSSPAHATVITATFSGTTAGFYSSGLSESSYTQQQQDYLDLSYANGGGYGFTISYDTDAVGVPGGTGFNTFAATLVSGHAGNYTNFSGFTATIDQVINSGTSQDLMYFRLHREDLYIPANFNRFTSDFTFVLLDQQGGLYANSDQLPSTIDPASLEQFNAELRISRTSGNYIYKTGSASLALGAAPAAVPESATWAMMLIGFGGIGYAARRKRQFAVSFGSARRRVARIMGWYRAEVG